MIKNFYFKFSYFRASEALLSPSVLIHDLGFLLWSKIVLNVEVLPDLWNSHTLDDTSDLGAAQLEQRLDIKEVCGENHLEQKLLLDIYKICVPFIDNIGQLVRTEWLVNLRSRVHFNLLEVLDNLL